MNLADVALRNRTTTIVLTIVLALGGVVAYGSLGRLEDPEFTIKDAKVITRYPGASAREVEEEVTDVVEAAVQQLGQLDYVTSQSQPGLSIVTTRIKDKYDKSSLPQVWDELRRKVNDAQGELPPGAGPTLVNDDFGDVFGAFFAVTGDGFTWRELQDYAEMLQRELLLVKDVAKVELLGVQEEVIYISISRARLAALGVSEDQVYAALARRNLVEPSGSKVVGRERIRLTPSGALDTVGDIGNTLVRGLGAERPIYLRDVADIERDYEDPPRRIVRVDGRPGIAIGISTVAGGNVVVMGDAVRARLRELQAETPVGMEITGIYDQPVNVVLSIRSFLVSLGQAVAIVIGVLLIAMGLRSGLLIGGILLLTILATFIVMKSQGVLLERISLGALIIALGMLVDNAIVVVEGILVGSQKGQERAEAARSIVKQTSIPLLGATAIAILAFAAIGTSQDGTGEFCRSLYQVILYSLALSWLLAVTVTPVFGTMFLRAPAGGGGNPYGGAFFRGFRALLDGCVRFRWFTVAVVAVLLVLALLGFGEVSKSFFPDSTSAQFTLDYIARLGTDIEKTESDLEEIEQHVLGLEQVRSVATFVGGGALRFMLTYAPEDPSPSYGQLIVTVDSYQGVGRTILQIEEWIRARFPGAHAIGKPFVLGPGGGSDIEARLNGPDHAVLRSLSEQVRAIMRSDPLTRDVRDDWREPVKAYRPILAETQLAAAGLTRADVSRALARVLTGRPVGLYREGDKLIPILARSPLPERERLDALREARLWSTTAQRSIPLEQVVSGYETVWEDGLIARRDRMPTITAECNVAEGEASALFERLRPRIEAVELPEGYRLELGGEYENSTKAQTALAGSLPIFGLLMVLIVIALFNALRTPLIIWLTVPLAIIGVTAGLLLVGLPFGFMAILAVLSLSGMLIKNSIVLIDEINLQRASGQDPYEALVVATLSRVRPVSMAALTTVLGMIPLVVDPFFNSMAVSIMGGLTFATVVTLLFVPTLYAIFFRIRRGGGPAG